MTTKRSSLPEDVDKIFKKIEGMVSSIAKFLKSYLPLFGRSNTQENAQYFFKGLLSDLPRKTAEPIAELWDLERKTMQRFVGSGKWDDSKIENQMVFEIAKELGEPDGILSIDPSSFPKQGKHSVGASRQWSGNLGKVDNCQVGVFASYSSSRGHTLVGKRLYLAECWAKNWKRRKKCKVPKTILFKKKWELADEILQQLSGSFPHKWVTSDSEFGRCGPWRDLLNSRHEKYVLDIPSNLTFHFSKAGVCLEETHKVSDWANSLKRSQWTRFEVRKTANGVKYVDAAIENVFTEDEDKILRRELLMVIRTVEKTPETKFVLSNAPSKTSLGALVKVADRHWLIEDCFKRAKGEVGMDQYEVRSWVGWHHHMTLSMLALWFLEREKIRRKTAFFPSDGSHNGFYHSGVAQRRQSRFEEVGKDCLEANETDRGCTILSSKECSPFQTSNSPEKALVIFNCQLMVQ